MLNKLKKTIKHSVIYSFGNLSSKLIGLILLPLYTQHLTTKEYGILALLEVTSQILILLLGLNLGTALLRWCSAEKDEAKNRSVIFTIFSTSIFIAIVSTSLLVSVSDEFSLLFFDHLRFNEYFTILFISIAFGILNLLPLNLIRVKEKPVFFVIITSLKFIVILCLNIYFVAYLKIGVKGIILSQLIGQVLLFVITLPFIFKNISFRFDFKILKEMLSYGVPLVFSSLAAMILSLGDRYLLKIFGELSDVGVYSLAYKMASSINVIIINSFQLGFLPLAFKYAGQKDSKRFFSKIQTYFTLLLVLFALFLSLFSFEIINLLASDKDYLPSFALVPFISFAFILKGMDYIFSLSFHQMKVTKYNAYIVSTSMLVNVTLNILLISIIGVYGAAISMVIAYGLMTSLSYHYSKKINFIPYEMKKLFLLLFLFLAFTLITFIIINNLPILLRLTIKICFIISFPVLLYLFNFFEEIEIIRVKQFWDKLKNKII